MIESLSFSQLREANRIRCNENFHPVEDWSPSDWGNAMSGEFGETAAELAELFQLVMHFFAKLKACDTIKKMLRQMEGDTQFEELRKKLSLEQADIIIYNDLLAEKLGIDLSEAVREKFNQVSVKRGSKVFL